jgi:hypothetical protein
VIVTVTFLIVQANI